jgi:hypothetical protein
MKIKIDLAHRKQSGDIGVRALGPNYIVFALSYHCLYILLDNFEEGFAWADVRPRGYQNHYSSIQRAISAKATGSDIGEPWEITSDRYLTTIHAFKRTKEGTVEALDFITKSLELIGQNDRRKTLLDEIVESCDGGC